MGRNRLKIDGGNNLGEVRMNKSSRGVHTIKEKCQFCGHHKKLVGAGVKRCAKCRR